MIPNRKTWLALLAAAVLASPAAVAADHLDGPAVTADPSADITDLFTWMVDGTHAALVMDVTPFAAGTGATVSQFSDAVAYTFHTTTQASFYAGAILGVKDAEIDVTCTFDQSGNPSCWVYHAGDTLGADAYDYVTGTAAAASSATGISSADGKVKIFAGPRNDPFFFNLPGFQAVISDVEQALDAGALNGTFNAAGCPTLPSQTAEALGKQLASNADGGLPPDTFAGADVLSIVVTIDTSLLLQAAGDTVLSVWGSTNSFTAN